MRGGYTGTYEQWCQDMANLGDNVAEVRTKAAQAAPERKFGLNTIFTDLNSIEGLSEGGPEKQVRETIPGLKKQPEQPRETAGDRR